MAEKKPSIATRKTPPTDDEWEQIWQILDTAHRARLVLKPLVAFLENWKAWLIAAAAILYLNSPKIIGALEALFTGWEL